jgi:hypothetical protein
VPLFRSGKPLCRLSLSANYAAAAGEQDPPWDVIDEDPAGQYGAGIVTIDRDGYYLITAGFGRLSGGSSSESYGRLLVNGGLQLSVTMVATANTVGLSGARNLFMTAGSTVEWRVNGRSTAGFTMRKETTYLEVMRIGPVRWT